jgi:hypothetical protein
LISRERRLVPCLPPARRNDLPQFSPGGGFGLGEGRGVLRRQALQRGLLRAVRLVVERRTIRRPARLPIRRLPRLARAANTAQACRTWGVESEKRPRRARFCRIRGLIAQLWDKLTAVDALQPTLPKPAGSWRGNTSRNPT